MQPWISTYKNLYNTRTIIGLLQCHTFLNTNRNNESALTEDKHNLITAHHFHSLHQQQTRDIELQLFVLLRPYQTRPTTGCR